MICRCLFSGDHRAVSGSGRVCVSEIIHRAVLFFFAVYTDENRLFFST